jgi:hypothetical protein
MSGTREVRLELLVGREVRDVEGRTAGRIEEVRADRVAEECHVRDYLLGPAAVGTRLLDGFLALGFVRALGARPRPPRAAPWHVMDLRDPEHPRLTVRCDELRDIDAGAPGD